MATSLRPGQFIGDTRSIRISSGVIVSEVRHGRARRLPRHGHELAFVSLLLRGRYEERWAPGMTWSYAAGTTAYHPPGFTHDDEVGTGGACLLCIELEPTCVQRLRDVAPRVLQSPCLLNEDGQRAGQRLYTAWRGTDRPNPFRLKACSSSCSPPWWSHQLSTGPRDRPGCVR